MPVHRKEVHNALHEGRMVLENQDARILDIRQLAQELEALSKGNAQVQDFVAGTRSFRMVVDFRH